MQPQFPNADNQGQSQGWNADAPQQTGMTTLLDAVEGIHFPTDKETLIKERGDRSINLTGHDPEQLRVVLLRIDENDFSSVSDLVQKLERAF